MTSDDIATEEVGQIVRFEHALVGGRLAGGDGAWWRPGTWPDNAVALQGLSETAATESEAVVTPNVLPFAEMGNGR